MRARRELQSFGPEEEAGRRSCRCLLSLSCVPAQPCAHTGCWRRSSRRRERCSWPTRQQLGGVPLGEWAERGIRSALPVELSQPDRSTAQKLMQLKQSRTMTPTPLDKGKGRADPLPLPTSIPSSPLPSVHSTFSTPRRKRALRHGRGPLIRDSDDEGSIGVPEGLPRQDPIDIGAMLCLALGVGCGLLLLAVAITHLWLGHVISEQGGVAEMGRGVAVGVEGIKWGEGGVEVWGKAGVDVKRALGWATKEKGGWMRRFEARVARWGTSEVGSTSVRVRRAVLKSAGGEELVVVEGIDTLVLPLSYPVGGAEPRMDEYSLVLPIDVVDPALLGRIAKEAWSSGGYAMRVDVEGVQVEPGASAGGIVGGLIRKLGAIQLGDILKEFSGRSSLFSFGSRTP